MRKRGDFFIGVLLVCLLDDSCYGVKTENMNQELKRLIAVGTSFNRVWRQGQGFALEKSRTVHPCNQGAGRE